MVVEQSSKKPVAAYIAFKTLETSTDALAASGVPRVLDRSAFPSVSGSVKSWIISSFQFLGFIDAAGYTQPLLHRWVREPDARPEIMASILRDKYAAVVALAEDSGTPQQFRAEIEKLGVSGSTTQKAIRFFLAAADFAGFKVPPTWKKMRIRLITSSKKKKDEKPAGGNGQPRRERPGEGDAQSEVVSLAGGGTVTLSIDANLLTLTPEDRAWLFGLIDNFKSYVADADDDMSDEDDEEGDY